MVSPKAPSTNARLGEGATEVVDFGQIFLLEAFEPRTKHMVVLDYTKSLQRVYTEFAQAAIEFTRALEPLYFSTHRNLDCLFSWVPDLANSDEDNLHAMALESPLLSMFHAGGPGRKLPVCEAEFDYRKMHIRGSPVDRVQKCFALTPVVQSLLRLE
ncbi:hypothetical protein B0H63DRAFT_519848 [Podospora didyma]|uniref:Uncharacterized protein n=1 Tax=Podospora didyma TaxID=330526 RepID=A0AAE0U4F3_9PEZI|nr:hypothetical protein B0H63DRAFT_519848 [Podospora didyma]